MAEATTATTATRQSRHDIGTRLQALCLFENKVLVLQIKEITGIATSQIYSIRKTVIARGYDLVVSKKLLLSYVEDAPRSGRPPKVIEDIKKQVVEVVTKNLITRQITTQTIANKINELVTASITISARIVWNILYSLGYSLYKPTYKPGLILEAKVVRLK
jgi:transposase